MSIRNGRPVLFNAHNGWRWRRHRRAAAADALQRLATLFRSSERGGGRSGDTGASPRRGLRNAADLGIMRR
jgi:hypothetical protein